VTAPRLLIALEDPGEAEDLLRAAAELGVAAEASESPEAALERLAAPQPPAVVLADPAWGGERLMAAAAAGDPGPAVCLLASFGTVGDAVSAMRGGAFDFLSRPAAPGQIMASVQRALDQQALRAENLHLRASLDERCSIGEVKSRDPRMRRIAGVVEAVADTHATVLVSGESGTGKTLLARTIHARSSRAAQPFVVINCGALPATLLETELFGHARGAFTGAVGERAGLFERGDGGTVFLDEIATAPLELQVKLLRVLQERVIQRVGETRNREVDVRLIVDTNRELPEEVTAGRFREDLYYRINVIRLDLPPLRERAGDVPLLASSFLRRFAEEYGRPTRTIRADAMAALTAHPWPGNVRELENAIERAVLLARGEAIAPADLQLGGATDAAPGPSLGDLPVDLGAGATLKEALREPERRIIEHALAVHGGNRQRTAEMLGVNRTTLFNKMRKHDLLERRPPR